MDIELLDFDLFNDIEYIEYIDIIINVLIIKKYK